ncbi:hypothetical protein SUGI_0213820 [Cryptomeria japonica]|uniref:homeobox-leucine zipper protein ATHB-21 n=1 Tax=Cryptomeria japonica TaxID=3369 RepID=UPI002408BD66|nr:homeobox-leucine zipper protein ATHB-21 [Cryptomeria japonica]GLJ13492.1 hypothetical protein SUGI_0213820 [Cryptomeria japonica]
MSFNFGTANGAVQLQQLQQIVPRMFCTRNADGLQGGSSLPTASAEAYYGRTLNLYDSLYEDSSSLCNEDEEASGAGNRYVEKKRRLSVEQVKSLEMSFEVENKLESERKMRLAAELGLQPRQVAVWFQNRRARWKNKQLQKEYDQLKQQFNVVLYEKEKLRAEVARLKQELHDAGKGQKTEQHKEIEQPTITSSDCTAILATTQNNTEEEETQDTVVDNKAEEGREQSMSPASFCSHADSNPTQMNSEKSRQKIQTLMYTHNFCDDFYYDDCAITAEESQWLTFCSHAKP